MQRSAERRNVNDLPRYVYCHKHGQERELKAACPSPTSYCRFRAGCLVWFAVHGGNDREEAPPAAPAGDER